MSRTILPVLLAALLSPGVSAQSKLVPVTKSELTGMTLPDGARRDKRILSTAAALTLLQMKAQEDSVVLEEQVEVLALPPSQGNTLPKQIKDAAGAAGWDVRPFTAEAAYSLLLQKDRAVLMYIESGKKETSLYLSPVKSLKPEKKVAEPVISPPANPAPESQKEKAPKEEVVVVAPVAEKQSPVPAVAGAGVFAFTTTNFDDGWKATITDDFVRVAKGTIEVQLIYPIQVTDEARSASDFALYYWQQLVAPQYNIRSTKVFEEPLTYFRTYFVEGEAINPRTNSPCYLALNVLINSGVASPVLAVTPDANTYYKTFPEPKTLGNMTGYNRFALAASDIVGKWSSTSGASVNLYNVYTGNYAGMNYAQSADSFIFNADGTYSSKHSGVSSVYGATNAYQQEYKGVVTVGQWEMSMDHRWKDATENFNAYFEVIKGGRILHIQNKAATGIWYHLVREN